MASGHQQSQDLKEGNCGSDSIPKKQFAAGASQHGRQTKTSSNIAPGASSRTPAGILSVLPKRGASGHSQTARNMSQPVASSVSRDRNETSTPHQEGNRNVRVPNLRQLGNTYNRQMKMEERDEKSATDSNGVTTDPDSSQQKRIFTLGFKRLEEIVNFDSNNEAVHVVANSRNGFENLIGSEIRSFDLFVLVLKVLRKVCQSDFEENKALILIQACKPEFLNQFMNKITQGLNFPQKLPDLISDMLIFFETSLHLLPNFSCEKLSLVVSGCQCLAMSMPSLRGIKLNKGSLENFASIIADITKLQENTTEKEIKFESRRDVLKYQHPPNDFRELSVYPTLADITGTSRPFLRPNLVEGRYRDVEHYLDVQFRLLHEDVIRPLREGIAAYRNGETKARGETSVRVYENVRFLAKEQREGKNQEGVHVLFDPLKKMKVDWEHCKRFIHGSLLCFTRDHFNTVMCATIANRDVKDLEKGILVVEFCDQYEENYYDAPYLMVESEVFYEPYLHVMNSLKELNEDTFPMKKYLVEVQADDDPPEYLVTGLRPAQYKISGTQGREFVVTVLDERSWPTAEQLGLDPSQHRALQAALTKELVVIQGPPGTGKTFMGLKIAPILINNKEITSRNKPILVVCLTNHALDQFLMGILPCTENVIRVGGQSRCEEMGKYNLKNLRPTRRSKNYIQLTSNIRDTITGTKNEMSSYLTNITGVKSIGIVAHESLVNEGILPQEVKNILPNETIYLEWLIGTSSLDISSIKLRYVKFNLTIDEVQKQIEVIIKKIEDGNANMHLQHQLNVLMRVMTTVEREIASEAAAPSKTMTTQWLQGNIFQLDSGRRWQLYRSWVQVLLEKWQLKVRDCEKKLAVQRQRLNEMQTVEDIEIMRKTDVIGMTTTCAARLHSLLIKLGPQIVIVEEAAEVMESHVVACLSTQCKHLILIGDHKQLRPNTAVYQLAKHFNFDVSLFERMVRNRGQCEMLGVQHRMAPAIASLIVPTIYKELENHESVLQFPQVPGIPQRLFFITHNNPEKQDSELSSRTNEFEARFVIALCRHLVLQGYHPSKITALTTYKGQMFYLKKEMRKIDTLQGVQATVVDNFQGEENDVIVLSLVRSNEENRIGFLATENRVCVALSRARHALYLVGNMDCLTEASDIWKSVRKSLQQHDAIGPALTLRCQVHPDQSFQVCDARDFDRLSPEGGCTLYCTSMLPCGHRCDRVCHSLNISHENMQCFYVCEQPCPALLHHCKKKCYEKCGDCMLKVLKTLPCGHEAIMPCYKDPASHVCHVLVEKEFESCGHKATVACYVNPQKDPCPLPCENRLNCGHMCTYKCHVNDDPDHLNYICHKPCGKYNLNCSTQRHECGKLCYENCEPCKVKIPKKRSCGHKHKLECSADSEQVICKEKCKKVLPCGHWCTKRCSEDCNPCMIEVDKVVPSCGHMLRIACGLEAKREMCLQKCERKLACSHPCRKVCGEPCSSRCKVEAGITLGACGHQVPLLCWEKSRGITTPSDLSHCREPCGEMLTCEHWCSGTCGSCQQGRLHQLCEMPCGKGLVCGHSCPEPCSAACPPCKKKCEYRCKHSRCDKICGEPCASCKERCDWSCVHIKCDKKCGDPCKRAPCNQPCPKSLPCGHDCVGLCGEPCPPLCRQCDAEELTEIFLGYEEDEDARFVYLPDCGHTVECQGLELWLGQQSGEIGVKMCPRCKTAINKAPRYSAAVKLAHQDFSKVKSKLFGNPKEIEQTRQRLENEVKNLLTLQIQGTNPKLLQSLKKALTSLNFLQGNRKNVFSNIGINIKEIHVNILSNICTIWNNSMNIPEAYKTMFKIHCDLLLDSIEAKKLRLGQQQVEDFKLEVNRLQRISQLAQIKSTFGKLTFLNITNKQQYDSLVEQLEKLVMNIFTRFTSDRDNTSEIFCKQIENIYLREQGLQKVPGLGITRTELQEIKNAIPSMHVTRWYKCNDCGHIYAVGDCGRPAQSSICPECKGTLGVGSNHAATNFPT